MAIEFRLLWIVVVGSNASLRRRNLFSRRGAFVMLAGLSGRQKFQVHWFVHKYGLRLSHNWQYSFVVCAERSPSYSQTPFILEIQGCWPTYTPKAAWLLWSRKRNRFSWLSVEELWSTMSLRLLDFFEPEVLEELHNNKHLTYTSMIRFGGNAFTSNSIGGFSIGTMLLPRLEHLAVAN